MEEEDVDQLPVEGSEKKVPKAVAQPANEKEEVLLQIISSGKTEVISPLIESARPS